MLVMKEKRRCLAELMLFSSVGCEQYLEHSWSLVADRSVERTLRGRGEQSIQAPVSRWVDVVVVVFCKSLF
jgi:hypothetical protein